MLRCWPVAYREKGMAFLEADVNVMHEEIETMNAKDDIPSFEKMKKVLLENAGGYERGLYTKVDKLLCR